MPPHASSLVALVCACTLAACIAPKAIVVKEPAPSAQIADMAIVNATPNPTPDDGFRTGELLVLPKETEYRPTRPAVPTPDATSGTVIVNPPNAKPERKKND